MTEVDIDMLGRLVHHTMVLVPAGDGYGLVNTVGTPEEIWGEDAESMLDMHDDPNDEYLEIDGFSKQAVADVDAREILIGVPFGDAKEFADSLLTWDRLPLILRIARMALENCVTKLEIEEAMVAGRHDLALLLDELRDATKPKKGTKA